MTKLIQHFVKISGLTLLSRISGLGRDVCFAALLGAGPIADAFFIAFRLPNFFRRLFAEGAFTAAFLPIFSGLYATQGLQTAYQYAEQIFVMLVVIVSTFVIIFELALPWTIHILAPGMTHDTGQLQHVLHLSMITFPYILCISLATFYGSILNSLNKFSVASAHPIILNIVMIISMSISAYCRLNLTVWLAVSVIISGILQWLWAAKGAERQGVILKWRRPQFTPNVKHLLRVMGPGALGAGVTQINLLIDTVFASLLPSGAISYLYYADRLNQLPLSLLGVGLSTALLPALSRHFSQNDTQEIHNLQNRALELSIMLIAPATCALIILAQPILSILFEHSKFTYQDVVQTTYVLQAYVLGLPAYVLTKILTTAFFAQRNTRTPVKIAIGTVIFNILLTFILMQSFKHVGIAMATALTAWLNVCILGIQLYKNQNLKFDNQLKQQSLKVVGCSIIMSLGLLILKRGMLQNNYISLVQKGLILFSVIILGMICYLISLWICRGLRNFKLKL